MSRLREDALYNASMVQDLANGVLDDLEQNDHENAGGALDELMTYASRLMRNLEDMDNEGAA